MKFNYYPGCTLKNQAKDLDNYARKSAEKLGIEMVEIEEWQCCGGVYPIAKDEIGTKLSSVRALDYCKHHGGNLLTLCSACHNVIKRVNNDMLNDKEINDKANRYLALEEPYNGETEVVHYLEMLRDYVGFNKIKELVTNKIGLKIAPYYGCLLLRPSKVLAFDNPEKPTILDNFILSIGGTPVNYSYKNECCGAYVGLKDKNIPMEKSEKIINSALEAGADVIVTACPLCYYNLTKNNKTNIRIVYFTELLSEALGVKEG